MNYLLANDKAPRLNIVATTFAMIGLGIDLRLYILDFYSPTVAWLIAIAVLYVAASIKIADEKNTDAMTMTGGIAFGKTCLYIIRQSLTPWALAARI